MTHVCKCLTSATASHVTHNRIHQDNGTDMCNSEKNPVMWNSGMWKIKLHIYYNLWCDVLCAINYYDIVRGARSDV